MTRTRRLLVVLLLNLALVAALITVGITAHSVAVFAEGGDYLLDAAAVGVALVAARIAVRHREQERPGESKATTIAALVNAGWLLLLELIVAGVAIDRLVRHTPRVDGLPVLVVSGVAALAMAAGALILRGDPGDEGEEGRDPSVAAVLLDTIADASAAAGVAIAGAIILAAGRWFWLDPAVALAVAVIFGCHAAALATRAFAPLRTGAQ
ncbi:MAG TPA: cation diffusion facilitator family transporter [Streptosporangiaceae bacterium]|jgi:cobalt-zinc-cadmium efflux system protein